MNKLKAGIIGLGYMGEIRKRILETTPDVQLTSIYEVDSSRLKNINPQSVKVFSSFEDFIKSELDLVYVCTPNSYSTDYVVRCLESGKHVFCEKPPGRTLQDIEKMIQAEKKYPQLKLMFGFNHRYHPGILEAKKIVESKGLGEIISLKGTYGKSGGQNYLQSWRNNKEISGGGILLDQGIHMLDLFRYFCGDFTEVKGLLTKMFWDTPVEDNAFVIMRNQIGQIAALQSSATLWRHTFKLDILLEKGYLNVSGLLSKSGSYGRETLVIGHRQFENEAFAVGNPREELVYFDQDLSWNLEMQEFIDCIRQNKKIEKSTSNDAYQVMKIIDTVYQNEKISEGKNIKQKEKIS